MPNSAQSKCVNEKMTLICFGLPALLLTAAQLHTGDRRRWQTRKNALLG